MQVTKSEAIIKLFALNNPMALPDLPSTKIIKPVVSTQSNHAEKNMREKIE